MTPPRSRPETIQFLAVIPARSGSRRIPEKNLRTFGGKPLILWTVEAARKSRLLQRVLVSTDSQTIADTARRAGLEVPFLRPAALATETAPMVDVIRHAVGFVEKEGASVSSVVTLQPTSPLRTADDIDAALKVYLEAPDRAVVSVSPASPPPEFWMRLEDDALVPMAGSWPTLRSQDAPPVYALNGSIYVTPRSLLRQGDLVGPRPRAYVMPKERSVDIDEESDWRIAEALAR